MDFIGVDGCKLGWFAVTLNSGNNWRIDVYKRIDRLSNALNSASIMFIDIPIGLSDAGTRTCDLETRKRLGPRRSSVFAVPCRKALQAENYRQACRINKQVTGVKLSIQTWNIAAKIKEVDSWLQDNRKPQAMVRESHPELCFWALAGGIAMAYPKKSEQGFRERYALLKRHYPQTGDIVQQAMAQFRRKDLARDDILDALALAVSARRGMKSIRRVPRIAPMDNSGLPMEMVYAAPE